MAPMQSRINHGHNDEEALRYSTSSAAAVSERTSLLARPSVAADDNDGDNASSRTAARQWKLVVLVTAYSSVLFLMACNATVITTTYGSIARDLHAYSKAATWLNVSYMVSHPSIHPSIHLSLHAFRHADLPATNPNILQIASSCTNPLIGRLSTIFDPVNLFLSCTSLFTLGSLLTGLAPDTNTFLLGRVITGCGAGGLFTTANVLLVQNAPVHRRGLLVGCINAVVTIGSSLGGVIGGAFAASSYGWVRSFHPFAPMFALGRYTQLTQIVIDAHRDRPSSSKYR